MITNVDYLHIKLSENVGRRFTFIILPSFEVFNLTTFLIKRVIRIREKLYSHIMYNHKQVQ